MRFLADRLYRVKPEYATYYRICALIVVLYGLFGIVVVATLGR